MTLRLIKNGEPEPDTVLRDRWEGLKAAGDALLAKGELEGFFVLLDAGDTHHYGVHSAEPMRLHWVVKRAAEQGMDEETFSE